MFPASISEEVKKEKRKKLQKKRKKKRYFKNTENVIFNERFQNSGSIVRNFCICGCVWDWVYISCKENKQA